MADYPESNARETAASFVEDEYLITTLSSLGFKTAHTRSALEALSTPNLLTTSLLGSLPPLEAAIEYLLLHVPEVDLPARFLPENNSSQGFVSSAHGGGEDILRRWAEERATREAGYPRLAVNAASGKVDGRWDLILELLSAQLTGFRPPNLSMDVDIEIRDMSRQGELEAVQAVYPDATFNGKTGVLSIPLPTAPAFLNIIYSPDHSYPEGVRVPPLYVSSSTMAPYIRLYLIAELVKQVAPQGIREAGEMICFTAVDILDRVWQQIEESGPPDMAEVIKNLMPPPKLPAAPTEEPLVSSKGPRKSKRLRAMDTRSDEQILKEFNDVKEQPKYKSMLTQRQKLPAWASQEEIVNVIGCSRVVVVVGETGCGKTTQRVSFTSALPD
jgi:ATP-dependent RNA helicase DHX57